MIYLGLDYEPPLEAHHSLIAATPDDINQYWWNHVETKEMLYEGYGLICWASHSDDSLAPKGKHVLNLIPEGFYNLKQGNWDDIKEEFIERSLDYYDSFAHSRPEKAH